MWGEVEVQVWNALAEHVDVDQLGAGLRLESAGDSSEHRPKTRCLGTVKIGDMGDVPLRLEVGESEHRCRQADREPPQAVLPRLDAPESVIAVPAAADDAIRRAHTFRLPD